MGLSAYFPICEPGIRYFDHVPAAATTDANEQITSVTVRLAVNYKLVGQPLNELTHRAASPLLPAALYVSWVRFSPSKFCFVEPSVSGFSWRMDRGCVDVVC